MAMFFKNMHLDLDTLFSYKTRKVVRVRDKRLGIPYYICMFLIFLYVILNIIFDKRYLKKETPGGGSIRMSLELSNNDKTTYKLENSGRSFDEDYPTRDVKWLYWDPIQVVYPAAQEAAMMITTRMTKNDIVYEAYDASNPTGSDFQECDPHLPDDPKCRVKILSSSASNYYIADIEKMTIMIEHTIRGNLIEVTKINKDLYGELLDCDDNVVLRFYPVNSTDIIDDGKSIVREEGKPGDIFPVGKLLESVQTDLNVNNPSSMLEGPERYESYRYTGMVIVVIIEYHSENAGSDLKYKYKPSIISGAEMKVLELQPNIDLLTEVDIKNSNNSNTFYRRYNRHGIEVKFIQLGEIGTFDFINLLTSLVASIAMLSVASLIVESLMLYILPEKNLYWKFKVKIKIK